MTKIRVYIQFGKYGRAYGLLQKMLYYAKEQKRNYIAIESMFLLALVKYHIKEEGVGQPFTGMHHAGRRLLFCKDFFQRRRGRPETAEGGEICLD